MSLFFVHVCKICCLKSTALGWEWRFMACFEVLCIAPQWKPRWNERRHAATRWKFELDPVVDVKLKLQKHAFESFWFSWCGYSAEGCCTFQSCGLNSFSCFAWISHKGIENLSQLWYSLNVMKQKGLFLEVWGTFSEQEENTHEKLNPRRDHFMWW